MIRELELLQLHLEEEVQQANNLLTQDQPAATAGYLKGRRDALMEVNILIEKIILNQ